MSRSKSGVSPEALKAWLPYLKRLLQQRLLQQRLLRQLLMRLQLMQQLQQYLHIASNFKS